MNLIFDYIHPVVFEAVLCPIFISASSMLPWTIDFFNKYKNNYKQKYNYSYKYWILNTFLT